MIRVGLDLGGKTGVAVSYDTGTFQTVTWNLTRGSLGGSRSPIVFLRLWQRLQHLALTHEIGHICFEETFARGFAKNRLEGLQAIVLLFAQLHGIAWMRVSPTAWKKAIIGHAHAPKDKYFEIINQKWPDVWLASDDEAAAFCVLLYAMKGIDNE